jgi:hypothetical protein
VTRLHRNEQRGFARPIFHVHPAPRVHQRLNYRGMTASSGKMQRCASVLWIYSVELRLPRDQQLNHI